jgi:PAS domain S-box-containing protein
MGDERRASDGSGRREDAVDGATFAAAFDGLRVPSAILAEDGRIAAANESLCSRLGHARAELLGRSLRELTLAEDAPSLASCEASLREAGVAASELRILRADGRPLPARLTLARLGGGTGVLVQLEDASDPRSWEERRAEARARALIEGSQDLIVLVDGRGHNVFTSASAEAILGFTPDEFRSQDFRELVHPDDREFAGRCFEETARNPGRPVRAVLRYRRKDGGYSALDSISRNLFDDPAVAAIVVNARDVSAQRHLEAQLAQAQRLESVGRLAGGVAHDFNNMLSVILSCVEFIELDMREGRPNLEDLEEIRKAGERARELTGQLLAVARRQVVAARPVELDAVVRDGERLFHRILGEDVILRVRLTPGLPPLLADPTQLHQVLLNLAANARDAMPAGGRLTVETDAVELDAAYAAAHPGVSAGHYVMLAVTDSGTGLSREAQAHLFEPFFTTKAVGKGTGLGLATVYGIVKQLGGHVAVYSEPSVGTTFKCYFPPAPDARIAPAPAAPLRAPRRATETILLVEDEAAVRALAARALERAGYRVLSEGSAKEAVARAREAGGVDLLLTDVVMPDMNGRQLTEEVLRLSPSTRVLFMSGYTQDVIVHHGVLDSGLALLQKPFTPSGLLAKVEQVLGGT